MTIDELKKFDGKNGQPAYVAVKGTIYDVSTSPRWKEGNHEDSHRAGCDLTAELTEAPHVAAVLERFPVVGRLQEKEKKSFEIAGIPLLSIIIMAFVFALMIATYML